MFLVVYCNYNPPSTICIRQPGPSAPACFFPCWLTSTLATLIGDERCFWEKQTTCLAPVFFLQPQWLAKERSHTVAYSSMCIIMEAHVTFIYFSKQIFTHQTTTLTDQCKTLIWWQSWSHTDLQPLHSPTYCRMSSRQQTHVENYFRKMSVLRLALTTEETGTVFNWQPVRLLKWGIQKLSRK